MGPELFYSVLLLHVFYFQLGQKHREQYTDKSGIKTRVDHFLLPQSAEDMIKKKAQL